MFLDLHTHTLSRVTAARGARRFPKTHNETGPWRAAFSENSHRDRGARCFPKTHTGTHSSLATDARGSDMDVDMDRQASMLGGPDSRAH